MEDKSIIIKRDKKILKAICFVFVLSLGYIAQYGSELPYFLTDFGNWFLIVILSTAFGMSAYYCKVHDNFGWIGSFFMGLLGIIIASFACMIFFNFIVGANELLFF
jgi:hypothetical protein